MVPNQERHFSIRTAGKLLLSGIGALALLSEAGQVIAQSDQPENPQHPNVWGFVKGPGGTVIGIGDADTAKNGNSSTLGQFVEELSNEIPGHQLPTSTDRQRCVNDLSMRYGKYLSGEEKDVILHPERVAFEVSPIMTPSCYDDPTISDRASGAAWEYFTKPEVMVQNTKSTIGYMIGAVTLFSAAIFTQRIHRWVMNGVASERLVDGAKRTASGPSMMEQSRELGVFGKKPFSDPILVEQTDGPLNKKWAKEKQKKKDHNRFRVEDFWGISDNYIEESIERLNAVGRASSFVTKLGILWGPKYANAAPLYDKIGELPDVSTTTNVTQNVDNRSIVVQTGQQPRLPSVPRLPHLEGGKDTKSLKSSRGSTKLLSAAKQ